MPVSSLKNRFRGSAGDRILAAIEAHDAFPSSRSISEMTGLSLGEIDRLRQKNPTITAALHSRVRKLVPKLSQAELFGTVATSFCKYVPEIASRRVAVISRSIRTYNGRPSLVDFTEHVTGKKGSDVLIHGPNVRQAVFDRFFVLLNRMTLNEIKDQRLVRRTNPEIREYLNERKRRENVEKKKPEVIKIK